MLVIFLDLNVSMFHWTKNIIKLSLLKENVTNFFIRPKYQYVFIGLIC